MENLLKKLRVYDCTRAPVRKDLYIVYLLINDNKL